MFSGQAYQDVSQSYRPDSETAQLHVAHRAGHFARQFADMWVNDGTAAQLGVDRAWLEQLGVDIEAALSVRGRHAKALTRLRALSARLVKDAKTGRHREAAKFFLEWVDALQADIRHRQSGHSSAGKLPRAWGVVLALIQQHQDRDVPYDLEAIVSAVVVMLPGEGISVTDVRSAIDLYTRAAPLKDWLGLH